MTLNPDNLSRPESFVMARQAKRYRAALRRRGLCAFCTCRVVTFGVVHCRGNESRQRGMCQDDGRLPQFRLDDTTLEEFRDAA
ncbi:hypothetical protein [Marilutibacter spongiae]|uniref:Uncharacterized protein n=1 Tax=Marilutibacter spongiae TaxID=2025720 RepID=A0A7W3Y5W6_9GAMM|nr:hypothetical protein [Lysobacter spongiae]MBB1060405.1 hypothetical protein [Lysobacter spongiae]